MTRQCRPRNPGRGRRVGAGPAALAPALGTALQPVRRVAAAVSAASGVPVAGGALKRVKATAQQVGLSRTERTANVLGAFRVPPEGKAAIVGRRLVLVDDVLTSGSTVEGCARALLRAGAANVDVLVFARVADPVRTSI